MKIVKRCICGAVECIDLTDAEREQFDEWRRGERYIQSIESLNACEREFLKTGMCRKCQSEIFLNGKTERVKAYES